MLLIAAVFVAVSVTPQAMAQSCSAKRIAFPNSFQTRPSSPVMYQIGFRTVINRVDDLHFGYTSAEEQVTLRTIPPRVSATLSLPGSSKPYLAGKSAPGGIIPPQLPQFNWWCYVQCLRMGGNPDDCAILCSGKPVQQ